MSYWVYILQSEKTGRYYCGQTCDLIRRTQEHNDPENIRTLTTKRFEGPWKLVCAQECTDRSSAMKLEKSIKNRGISRFLRESPTG